MGADRIGEEGIDAHARGQDNGSISHEGHDQAANHRGKDGGKDTHAHGNACIRQNQRIDDDDIGNGEEGGDACQYFPLQNFLVLQCSTEKRAHE